MRITRIEGATGHGEGVLWWSGRILQWTVILAGTAAAVLAVLLPRVAGAVPYAILSGSMQPTLPAGSLVVVRPVPADRIGVGSVITYQVESGDPTTVTHRVAGVGYTADGRRFLRTRGDANDSVDARPVLPVQVAGTMWYSVPLLGYAPALITPERREQVTLLVSVLLGAYTLTMFVGAARDGVLRQVRRRGARRVPGGLR